MNYITDNIKFLVKGCSCKKGCKNKKCGCRKEGRHCKAGCECVNCTYLDSSLNSKTKDTESDTDDSKDDDDTLEAEIDTDDSYSEMEM